MTKEQLLASLKPLKWMELNDQHKSYEWGFIESAYVVNIGEYFLNKDGIIYFRYFHGYIKTAAATKDAAQEHYNNLVLNLFNLED